MAAAQQLTPMHQVVPPAHPYQHPITLLVDQADRYDPISKNNCPCGRLRRDLLKSYVGSEMLNTDPESRQRRRRVYKCLLCDLEVVSYDEDDDV